MARPVLQSLAKRVQELFVTSESNVSATPPETPPNQSPLIALNRVYYHHMRFYNTHNQLMPWGGGTIAYQVTKEDPDDIDMVDGQTPTSLYFIDLGIANCRFSDKGHDLFCKRIGRDIALARLLDDDKAVDAGVVGHHPTHSEVITKIREAYYQEREEFSPQVRLMVK